MSNLTRRQVLVGGLLGTVGVALGRLPLSVVDVPSQTLPPVVPPRPGGVVRLSSVMLVTDEALADRAALCATLIAATEGAV